MKVNKFGMFRLDKAHHYENKDSNKENGTKNWINDGWIRRQQRYYLDCRNICK